MICCYGFCFYFFPPANSFTFSLNPWILFRSVRPSLLAGVLKIEPSRRWKRLGGVNAASHSLDILRSCFDSIGDCPSPSSETMLLSLPRRGAKGFSSVVEKGFVNCPAAGAAVVVLVALLSTGGELMARLLFVGGGGGEVDVSKFFERRDALYIYVWFFLTG